MPNKKHPDSEGAHPNFAAHYITPRLPSLLGLKEGGGGKEEEDLITALLF